MSDIDILSLYIKSCFVSILNANKLLPFDTMGIMTSSNNSNIKNGETFEVFFNITATNSQQLAEWFIVKDESAGLTKDNIIDTLIPDQNDGYVSYSTKEYKKGKNILHVTSRLKIPQGDRIMVETISFTVK